MVLLSKSNFLPIQLMFMGIKKLLVYAIEANQFNPVPAMAFVSIGRRQVEYKSSRKDSLKK